VIVNESSKKREILEAAAVVFQSALNLVHRLLVLENVSQSEKERVAENAIHNVLIAGNVRNLTKWKKVE